jgi:hypothetical protein
MRSHRLHLVAPAAAIAAILTAASPSASHAQSAEHHPDVIGVWKMDTTKFNKRDAELSALTLTVSHRGDTLVIVTDVVDAKRPPMQMRSRYLPERVLGSAALADTALAESPLSWAGDTLVLRRVEQRPDRKLEIEERWAFDASDHTLYRQQTVVDGRRVSKQTLVFTRP